MAPTSDASGGAGDDRPNLLVFLPDQHRPDWIGAAGDVPVRTPNLDALAEQGVRFENAITPSPVCAPARSCLATGYEYEHNPVQGNADDLPPSTRTYYRQLRESGYHVMGCGKFDLHKGSFSWGVDGTHRLDEWGFSDGIDNAGKLDGVLSLLWDDHPTRLDDDVDALERACEAGISGRGDPAEPYTAHLEERGLLADYVAGYRDEDTWWTWSFPEDAYVDNWIARQGLSLLEDAPEGSPWHLVVNFAGPHAPFDVTEAMHEWYRDPPVAFDGPVGGEGARAPEDHQEIRRNYAAMIENVDRWLGTYLETLDERGELEETLVVFTSDHGEMLGDHGHWGKVVPYQPSVGVPMVVAGAGVASREPFEGPVSLLDLHDTFLDYAGVARPEATDSRSLRPVLEGTADDHRECAYSGLGDWRLAFDGRHKLVTNWTPDDGEEGGDSRDESVGIDGPAALFDLEADPEETENLLDERPAVARELRDRLD